VDFVDEEHFATFEGGEKTGEVTGFEDGGSAAAFGFDAHGVGEDIGECGFAETGGAAEEDVFEDVVALAGGVDHEFELVAYFALTTELLECTWAQGEVEGWDRGESFLKWGGVSHGSGGVGMDGAGEGLDPGEQLGEAVGAIGAEETLDACFFNKIGGEFGHFLRGAAVVDVTDHCGDSFGNECVGVGFELALVVYAVRHEIEVGDATGHQAFFGFQIVRETWGGFAAANDFEEAFFIVGKKLQFLNEPFSACEWCGEVRHNKEQKQAGAVASSGFSDREIVA